MGVVDKTWGTDPQLFETLPGGSEIVSWFGFCPSFHDAELVSLELTEGTIEMRINAFRMTNEVDASGYYVLDRHTQVCFELVGVSGLALSGCATSNVALLSITQVSEIAGGWKTCGGPEIGDYKLEFSANFGLEGAIFAKEIKMSLRPVDPPLEPFPILP